MSLKSRLKTLERRHGAGRPLWMEEIPWETDLDGEPRGMEVDGRFMTWEEIHVLYPEAPWPIGWDCEVKP